MKTLLSALAVFLLGVPSAAAQTRLQIMPPDGIVIAAGQKFDLRIEATSSGPLSAKPPAKLRVSLNAQDITSRNELDPGEGGERGAGGTGKSGGSPLREVVPAAPNTTNFLIQDFSLDTPGTYTVTANTADGVTVTSVFTVAAWNTAVPGADRAKNIILLLGDGMGAAHRTAARIVSRGLVNGRAAAPLAMDRLPVTGMVMTSSLNAIITDSSPGMSSYATGHKSSNNQEGVYPDNTSYAFDNPRVEYIGEMLRRTRGRGFNVGIVTTSDVTDATPGANAIHTAERGAGADIAGRFFDERETNGVTVLLGGGRGFFQPEAMRGRRLDDRDVVKDFTDAGYAYVATASALKTAMSPPPARLLGLFHSTHLNVAFDKVGVGKYSDELSAESNKSLRDQPMLDDMTRAALASLSAHSPDGFYLMVEGASIDKQAHQADAERAVWDAIEFDNAVAVALAFAEAANTDADPGNDTLVIVTADHESGGLGIIGVGNPKYTPETLNAAVRDYSAVFRFTPVPEMNFFTNYTPDASGFPTNPDPSRKLLFGWAAGPDRFENWLSNRLMLPASIDPIVIDELGTRRAAIANPMRDGSEAESDNRSVKGQRIPGFHVGGTIENGAGACETCGDTSIGHTIAGHTASDVPLSASGPGMWQFTGVYENTDVFLKILRAATGSYDLRLTLGPHRK